MHTPILRYHGGKYRLATWIMSFFPEHHTYCEPFSGAASVLLRKPRSHGEAYNDIDQEIFNLFQVLRDPISNARLIELCELTPYSRDEFKLAYERCDDPIERARRTVVRSLMGFGTGAANLHMTGFRADAKRKSNTPAHAWHNYPGALKYVCDRLRGVNIDNRPALDCIRYYDTKETLFYVDPPYLFSTRNLATRKGIYHHEMTDDDHVELLNTLKDVKGMVALSGYYSELYNDMLPDWQRHERNARISASKGTSVKTECIWLNPACQKPNNK